MNKPNHYVFCFGILTLIFLGCKPEDPKIPWISNREQMMANPPEGMKFIKGGTFRMGGLPGPFDANAEVAFSKAIESKSSPLPPMKTPKERALALMNAKPVPENDFWHQFPSQIVEVGDFFMDSTEVTEKQWLELMGGTSEDSKGETFPANERTWYHAILFCNAKSKKMGFDTVYSFSGIDVRTQYYPGLFTIYDTTLIGIKVDMTKNGFRLPTEAEYEYAARAGTDSKFPWGDDEDTTQGWWDHPLGTEVKRVPQPVATKKANGWGLYDMVGNLPEWVNDAYEENSYSSMESRDPHGPEDPRVKNKGDASMIPGKLYVSGSLPRVYRGAEMYDGFRLRPTRYRNAIDALRSDCGFRTVLQVR